MAFCLALVTVFSLSPARSALYAESGQLPRAMWVWDARLVLKPETRNALLQFCRRHSIQTLYLSAYNLQPPLEKGYRDFNIRAHRMGITVHALAGDPRWGQSRYHQIPLDWCEAVRAFNAQGTAPERFDGIHSDVEVYLLSKSWNERPAELLGGYLDLHVKMRDSLRQDRGLTFGVDIPFWFDDDPSFRILWQGAVKPPSYHILDLVDEVAVMAYRNFAEGPDGTIQLVSLEMDYADRIGKKVMVGQETQEDLFPAYVTFGGTSCQEFNLQVEKIESALGSRPSFGGIALHHYESYKKLCAE